MSRWTWPRTSANPAPIVRATAGARLVDSPPRLRAMLGLALSYLVVPALLGWFTFVAIAELPQLAPQDVRTPTPTVYDPYIDDFAVFYAAGQLATAGHGDRAYDLAAIQAQEAALQGKRPYQVAVLPFFNPPYTMFLFAPLTLAGVGVAAAVWTAVSAGIFATTLVLLTRGRLHTLSPAGWLLLGVGILSSLPAFELLLHGQLTALLVAGLAMFWMGAIDTLPEPGRSAGTSHRRRPALAAGGLVLLALKPQFLPLAAGYLLVTRQWKTLAIAAGAGLLLLGAAAAAFGPAILADWVRLLAQAAAWDDSNGISTWGMFGWNGFSRGLLGDAPAGMRLALTLSLDAATVAAFVLTARRGAGAAQLFTALVLAALVVSPHLYAHDLLLLVVPLTVLFTRSEPRTQAVWMAYAIAGWFLLYYHFDILAGARINVTALWLAAGLILIAVMTSNRPRLRRGERTRPVEPDAERAVNA